MTSHSHTALTVSLANRISPAREVPSGLFDDSSSRHGYFPGLKVEFVDDHVLKEKASGRYRFRLTDVPAEMKAAKVVHMAFKKVSGGNWTKVRRFASPPFFVCEWPTATKSLRVNDIPVRHSRGAQVAEAYEVLLVIEYKDANGNVRHTCCDPEIHNEPA